MFDDAIDKSDKHLVNLAEYHVESVLIEHVANANYLMPSTAALEPEASVQDRTFTANNNIWEAILFERVRSGMNVKLDSFFLFEWFPRSPGLFHSELGRWARQEAQSNVLEKSDATVIYNPSGKKSMLDGGVGNIRLRPIETEDGELWLMCASSNGTCHEGFPVAVPQPLYDRYIGEIADRGTTVCDLVGKLRFIPERFAGLYREAPQLYLLVEEIRPASHPKSRSMEDLSVSVATMFVSDFDGANRPHACYVNFDPSIPTSLREHIQWMEQEYVVGRYKGRVITDFDEQRSHFPNAPFSLEKVMNLEIDTPEARNVIQQWNLYGPAFFDRVDLIKNVIGEIAVNTTTITFGNNNTFNGDVIAAGIIRDSFNKASGACNDEVKGALENLTTTVASLCEKLHEQKEQQKVARRLKSLVEEASSSEPDKGFLEVTGKGLVDAAKAAAAMVGPVTIAVKGVLSLFGVVL